MSSPNNTRITIYQRNATNTNIKSDDRLSGKKIKSLKMCIISFTFGFGSKAEFHLRDQSSRKAVSIGSFGWKIRSSWPRRSSMFSVIQVKFISKRLWKIRPVPS